MDATEVAKNLAHALEELELARVRLCGCSDEHKAEALGEYMAARTAAGPAFEEAQRLVDLAAADFAGAGDAQNSTPAPDGWQGEMPAAGTRRFLILETIRAWRADSSRDVASNHLSLADAIEEALRDADGESSLYGATQAAQEALEGFEGYKGVPELIEGLRALERAAVEEGT